jgi:hypothetical protein
MSAQLSVDRAGAAMAVATRVRNSTGEGSLLGIDFAMSSMGTKIA